MLRFFNLDSLLFWFHRPKCFEGSHVSSGKGETAVGNEMLLVFVVLIEMA